MQAHDRFDELAVGHVLGGLDPVDAAEFRSHLVGCRICRLRVAELRDLASELAAAEREERAVARLKTEVRHEDDAGAEEPEQPGWLRAVPGVGVALVVVFVLSFWAYHLRDNNRELVAVSERQSATLELLARGEPLEARLVAPVRGTLTATDVDFAFTLSGLPVGLPDGEFLAVWLVPAQGQPRLVESLLGLVPEGRLAMSGDRGDAAELVISIQPVSARQGPAGRELVRADFPGASPGATSELTLS